MNGSPRIALLVDEPQRDLGGLVLLGHELARRGATCYLVPSALQARDIWALAPDLVLLFNLRKSFEPFVLRLQNAGIQYCLLDSEGGVWATPTDYLECFVTNRQILDNINCVCCWGPGPGSWLADSGLFPKEKLFVTGCPRFDFYHAKWRSSVTEAQPRDQVRVLLNTNATEVNPRYGSTQGMKSYLKSVCGWSATRINDCFTIQRRALDEMIGLTRRLASDYADQTIVLRPHPFESRVVYREHLKGLHNLEMNEEGAIQGQILRAAAVIQRSCTTAIEAGLASVPTLSPQWVPVACPVNSAESVSVPCGSYDELRQHLDAILAGQFVLPPQVHQTLASTVRELFHEADGLAHQRVAEAILGSFKSPKRVQKKVCQRYLYGEGQGANLGYHLRRHLIPLGLPPEWSFRYMRVVPAIENFNVPDVDSFVRIIQGCSQAPSHRDGYFQAARAHDADYICRWQGRSVTLKPQRENGGNGSVVPHKR